MSKNLKTLNDLDNDKKKKKKKVAKVVDDKKPLEVIHKAIRSNAVQSLKDDLQGRWKSKSVLLSVNVTMDISAMPFEKKGRRSVAVDDGYIEITREEEPFRAALLKVNKNTMMQILKLLNIL